MTQGTRIALVLLVLLVLGTGAYWLGIGLRTPTGPDDQPAPPAEIVQFDEPEMTEPPARPVVEERRSGEGASAPRGSASRRAASGDAGPTFPPSGAPASPERATISPDGPVHRAADGLAPQPPEFERSTFLESPALLEVGGKSDVPGFTVVTPVGPEPDPANPPRDFSPVPAESRTTPAAPERETARPVERDSTPPAARRDAGAVPMGESVHVVEEGDTFVTIAEAWFGDRTRWALIQEANPGVDPTRLRIGQRITLPPRSAGVRVSRDGSAPTARASGANAASGSGSDSGPLTPGSTHVVRAGDTLYSIARRAYNDGTLWRVIYEANRSAIADPAALRPGARITIPAR